MRDNARSYDWPVIIRAVNTVDAMTATIEQIEQSLTGTDLCDGAIIGMHSTNPNCVTADGLSRALPILYGKGYRFCTLSELLELRGISYNDLPKGKYIDRISKQPDGTVKYN